MIKRRPLDCRPRPSVPNIMGGGKSRAGGVRDFLKWPSFFLLLPPATAAAATISEIMEVNQFDDGGSEHEVPPLYNTGVSGGPSRT